MDGVPPPVTPAPRGLWERWLAWRDRQLASRRFQDLSLSLPGIGRIARKRSEQLWDLTAGFVYSQVLLACIELDLFERLAGGPREADDIAREIEVPVERAVQLLDAAVSLGLLEKRRGLYRLGQLGAACRGVPGLGEMIRHHALFYRDLADPVALLRGEAEPALARYWGYVGGRRTHELGAEEALPYTRLMAATQAMVSAEVLGAYRFSRHRRLMDVGGGDGSFLRAVAAETPELRLVLFDLPAVAEEGRARFAEAGLADRAEAHGGDFFADPLPKGCDAISLVRVIYDHDDDAVRRLLARVREALPPKGTLILAEPMADTPGMARVGDAYFNFYIMAMTHGRPRSAARLAELLREAGFGRIRVRPTRRPFLTGLMTATPR
mgnify:CR=1 FL=1